MSTKDLTQLRSDLVNAEAEAQAFRGSEPYKAFVAMLNATEAVYVEQLVTATAEQLAYRQGAIQQLRAIQRVMNQGSMSGRNSLLI